MRGPARACTGPARGLHGACTPFGVARTGPNGKKTHITQFGQGVAGEDFVALTSEVLQKDLRVSAFTAHKLLRLRDAFLGGL